MNAPDGFYPNDFVVHCVDEAGRKFWIDRTWMSDGDLPLVIASKMMLEATLAKIPASSLHAVDELLRFEISGAGAVYVRNEDGRWSLSVDGADLEEGAGHFFDALVHICNMDVRAQALRRR